MEAWAEATAERLRGVLTRPATPRSEAREFAAAALTNLTLDRPVQKLTRSLYPFVLGPHRLGKLIGRFADRMA